jgi:hypothetical protein
MINRFSAFLASADLVKLKEPVITVFSSMIMTLLCAIACARSIQAGYLGALEERVRRVFVSLLALVEQNLHLDPAPMRFL